jgi:hypothetical protein
MQVDWARMRGGHSTSMPFFLGGGGGGGGFFILKGFFFC